MSVPCKNLQPVAVVGISAEFPSGTFSDTNFDHQSFFDFLLTGNDASERVPKERFNIDGWQGSHLGQVLPAKACFLKDIHLFDHFEFGISSKDAVDLGVGTRKLLEHAFLALLDSGIDSRSKNVGVYASAVAFDLLSAADADEFDARDGYGGGAAAVANRVSYHLDLLGPSIPVDTACSSTLTALHLGVQALRAGDCGAAVIGGSQINHRFLDWVSYSQWSILSPTGSSLPFDASADGFGRGEAVVVIVIKLLEDAIRDGDKIYATVLNTAINSTGSAGPVKTPIAESQAAAMINAYKGIGRSPTEVDFIECHATGTSVGDPVEVNWIGANFRRDRELVLGSIKANIGHTEITSFLASLSKVCSMFAANTIPPQPGYKTPNPAIHWDEYNMRVPTQVEEFTSNNTSGRRLVSMNSFGLMGANGHAIIESPPLKSHQTAVVPLGMPVLLVAAGLSPRSATAVAADLIELASEIPTEISVLSTIYGRRARQLTWRSAAIQTPDAPLIFPAPRFVSRGALPVVFVFSGQGPQHIEMGRQLFKRYPVFRDSIIRMDKIHVEVTGASIVSDIGLFGDARPKEPLSATWPLTLTVSGMAMVQMALVDLLAAFGIRPNLVFGHSAGEVAMSYASGAVSQEQAVEIAIRRSRAMTVVEGSGGMAAVSCVPSVAYDIMREVLREGGTDDVLELACYNAPEAVTISGTHAMLDKAVAIAQSRGLFARKIRARVPGHSRLMEPCKVGYLEEMDSVFSRYPGTRAPVVAAYSTQTGQRWSELTPEYMWNNCRVPVKFEQTVTAVVAEMPEAIFIEIGPHPALSSYITAMGAKPDNVICPMARTGAEISDLLTAVGKLFILGVNSIDFRAINGTHSLEISRRLPVYPLAPKPMPLYSDNSQLAFKQKRTRKGPLNHQFLGINALTHPDLAQHIINGEPIVPATGFVEMILEEGARTIWDIELLSLLPLLPEKVLSVDIKLNGHAWSITSSSGGRKPRLHATGFMITEVAAADKDLGAMDLDAIRARCTRTDVTTFYDDLHSAAAFGPLHRRVEACHEGENEILFTVRGNAPDLTEHYNYVFHPSVLDCCLHGMLHPLFIGHSDRSSYYLPSHIGRVILHDRAVEEPMPNRLYSYMVARDWTPESVACDAVICNEQGERLVTVINCVLSRHSPGVAHASTSYEYVYQPLGMPPAQLPSPPSELRDYSFLDYIVDGEAHRLQVRDGTVNLNTAESLITLVNGDHQGFEAVVRSISSRPETEIKPSSILRMFSASQDMSIAAIRPILDHAATCGKQVFRILDIGDAAGSIYNSLIVNVLPEYPTLRVDYTASGHEQLSPNVRVVSFNIDAESKQRGLTPSTYDLIIVTHTLDFAADRGRSLALLNGLLVAGGFLLALEGNGAPHVRGGQWIDYVFSPQGVWGGLRSGKQYQRQSRSGWEAQLSRANFRLVDQVDDVDSTLFMVLRAQKHSLPLLSCELPVSHVEPPIVFFFEASRVLDLQQILLSNMSSGGRFTVWIVATLGTFDGAVATGFSRSLAREVVSVDIRLVLFDPVWQLDSRIAAIHHLSQMPSLEPEIALGGSGVVLVPRLRSHNPRTPPRLNNEEYWTIRPEKTIIQSASPLPAPHEVLVKISYLSDVEGGLQGVVGIVACTRSSRLKMGEWVVAVTTPSPSNLILVHDRCITGIPEMADKGGVASAALALVLVGLGLSLNSRPLESLQNIQVVVICNGRFTSSVTHVLAELGIEPTLIEPSLPVLLPRLFPGDVIMTGTSPAFDSTIPRLPGVSFFNWEHMELGALQAVTQNPWVVGTTLTTYLPRVLQDAHLLHSVTPQQLVPSHHKVVKSLALADNKFYLILGGIGSLGVHIAIWMYRKGARHIVLASRTGVASGRLFGPQTRALRGALEYLKSLPDLDLRLEACDASSTESLAALIASLNHPIAGCILTAVVLSNGIFLKHNAATYPIPFKSKTDAYFALERALAIEKLDFFVSISSVAGFGVAGQTNYASASTGIEHLTGRHPNAWSLVAPLISDSIGLSPSMSSHMEQWQSSAMNSHEICLCLEDGLLRMKDEQISVYVPDLNWNAIHRSVSESPLYDHLVKLPAVEEEQDVEDPQLALMEIVLKFVDAAEPEFESNVPLTWYGLDSLSAARLSTALKPYVNITQMQLLGDLSLDDLFSKMQDAELRGPAEDPMLGTTEGLFAWNAFNQPGQTLLKLSGGTGIPLIILHGGAGDIAAFRAIQEQFTTPLWAIQPTPDAPLDTVDSLAHFYFEHIKAEQATGPYRIAGFSASSLVTLRLAQLLEASGDEIRQLSFIDHFPMFFTSGLHGFVADFETYDELTQLTRESSVAMVADCCRRDPSYTRRAYGEKLIAASKGLPSTANAVQAWEWIKTMQGIYLKQIIEFGGGLSVWTSADRTTRTETVRCRLVNELAQVRAPMTVHIANWGLRSLLPSDWSDLGISLGQRETRTLYYDAGHFDMFEKPDFARSLEVDWMMSG